MEKKSKLFVAGGGGLVGSAILETLGAYGFTHVVAPSHAELDLQNEAAVKNFFSAEKPEYVILAAARVGGIKANMSYPADFLYQNLAIQQNVIWQSHLHEVQKLLFLGSNCIYPRAAAQPMKEEYLLTGPLEPTNEAYAIAKIAGVKLAEKIHEQFGKNFISCLPPNIYGKRDHFDFERGHVMPALIRRFHEAKVTSAPELVLWGTGKAQREFLHADDLADAVIFLMEHYDAKEPINVGAGEDLSIAELATLVKTVVGYEGTITFDATKPDGMPRKLLDVSNVRALGWKSKIGLKDGITETYEWYLKNVSH